MTIQSTVYLFVILGTLGMPKHAWTVSVKIVVLILNFGGVNASKKTETI